MPDVTYGDRVLVLVSSVAHGRFAAGLARPDLDWLVMAPDGGLVDSTGAPVDRERAEPEVAWATSDLFRTGAPLRPFLGLARRAPSLRWFQSPAAGYDDPVFREMATRGVTITNAHVNGVPIAEFVLRSVLDEFQDAATWRSQAARRVWEIHDWREVAGTTWLVIGLGGIGSEVAVRARALGAAVVGCRRHPDGTEQVDRMVTPDALVDVVGEADVVVLAAPAGPSTDRLVDDRLVARFRPGSILVNVARGSLIDEAALLSGLDGGHPAVAVLDVFATEPLADDHPFWTHPQVRVTPHNAAGGTGRHLRQAALFADNLDRYLTGDPLAEDVTAAVLDTG